MGISNLFIIPYIIKFSDFIKSRNIESLGLFGESDDTELTDFFIDATGAKDVKKYDIILKNWDMNDLKPLGVKFDMITLFRSSLFSLDHKELLDFFYDHLNPGGLLIIDSQIGYSRYPEKEKWSFYSKFPTWNHGDVPCQTRTHFWDKAFIKHPEVKKMFKYARRSNPKKYLFTLNWDKTILGEIPSKYLISLESFSKFKIIKKDVLNLYCQTGMNLTMFLFALEKP